MKNTLTIARITLKSSWRAVCRLLQFQPRWLTLIRPAFNALLLALVVELPALAADLAAGRAADLERRLHPAVSAPPFRLPAVFDEQTVVTLGDGRLMSVPPEGNATIVSSDQGRTWSAPRTLRITGTPPVTPTRGPLIRTRSGVLIIIFHTVDGTDTRWDEAQRDWTPAFHNQNNLWMTRSRDNGETWDVPQQPFPGNYGTIVSTIQTSDGSVVVPIQVTLQQPGRWGMYGFVTKDDGQTWQRSNLIDIGGNGHHDGAIEATVAEMSNGRLLMLIRTGYEKFWEAYSDNHGRRWQDIRHSQLDSAAAPGQLRCLADGRLVLVWSRLALEDGTILPRSEPSASYAAGVRSQRRELALSYSTDDAKTWSKSVVIARQTKGSISYPFIFEPIPGELWIWTRYGSMPPLYMRLSEQDIVGLAPPTAPR